MSDIVERLREYAKDWRTRAASKAIVDEAADAIERLRADADPAVCRLQFPDGHVPGNAREAAEGWHRWYQAEAAKWLSEIKLKPKAYCPRCSNEFGESSSRCPTCGWRAPGVAP